MAETFTVAEFLVWARTKPAGETFDFCNSSRCALAQYGLAIGRADLVGPRGTAALSVDTDVMNAFAAADNFGQLVSNLEALAPSVSDTWTRPDAYMNDIESVSA